MWKIYGHGELAVMLMLDYKLIKEVCPCIFDCIYEDSDEYMAITKYLKEGERLDTSGNPKRADLERFLAQFPYLAKDKHYAYEQEIRVFHKISKKGEKLNYRSTGKYVKPFKSLVFPKEVLKGIMIGPGSDEEFDLNKQAITWRLEEQGFDHLADSIVKSDILIRQ